MGRGHLPQLHPNGEKARKRTETVGGEQTDARRVDFVHIVIKAHDRVDEFYRSKKKGNEEEKDRANDVHFGDKMSPAA
jgi:hypothetical protein